MRINFDPWGNRIHTFLASSAEIVAVCRSEQSLCRSAQTNWRSAQRVCHWAPRKPNLDSVGAGISGDRLPNAIGLSTPGYRQSASDQIMKIAARHGGTLRQSRGSHDANCWKPLDDYNLDQD
jgi:hypothetical protein